MLNMLQQLQNPHKLNSKIGKKMDYVEKKHDRNIVIVCSESFALILSQKALNKLDAKSS